MSLKEEFAGVDLGDERLNKRLVELASCFERRHGGGVLLSCPTWKEAKAAYRFFDNGRFDEQAIMAPHCACTAKRVNQLKEPVLVIHDTTEFNYTHHTKTEGLGYRPRYLEHLLRMLMCIRRGSLCILHWRAPPMAYL
jgi:hypothetical protein